MFFLLCSYFYDLQSRRDRKNTEVLFKRHHVTHTPWGEYVEWDSIQGENVPLQNVCVKVKRLRHITHDQPARDITREVEYFNFKPAQKKGKAHYNKKGLPIGETYIMLGEATEKPPTTETKYRRVSSQEDLFPGYYSWWSVDLEDYSQESQNYYFSQVFTSSSRYGNNKFSGNIIELLQCYQKAYDINPLPCIQFRCGGTLRYKQEICKVVIVCTDAYPLPEDEFPVMWEGHPIITEEADEIKLLRSVETLEVVIKNGITGAKTSRRYTPYSWDTYAFGFYFPYESYTLKCPKSVIKQSEFDHDERSCVKKVHNKVYKKFICPNNLLHLDLQYENDDEEQVENYSNESSQEESESDDESSSSSTS